MKISFSWLKKIIKIDKNAEQVAQLLTDSGLEVESIERIETVKGGLKGLLIGEVVEKSKHPDADKLSITKVNVGTGELLNIVCGAPNVDAGQKVVVATVGTKLFPSQGEPFIIKKSKIRGAVSEGMLCAEDEIGLGTSHAGIMVLDPEAIVGTPANEYFNVDEEVVFEIGLTPNRGDAASHYGVARELATILNCLEDTDTNVVRLQGMQEIPGHSETWKMEVKIVNQESCKRYSGVVISGVRVTESPDWLKNALNSIGVRPINNIVDITNFVLHETGQPLHAFDADKIKGKKVIIRNAEKNEKLLLLDGTEIDLSVEDLVICDEKNPMCLAGIFGGQNSGVINDTTSVFLESAYFSPETVRKSSKRHSLKTDASFRFERGTDPEMVPLGLIRAINLILEIAGGVVASETIDTYPIALLPNRIAFSYKNCFSLIGKEIPKQKIKNILTSLGIKIVTEGNDGLVLDVPTFKSDVTREADVCEEILRIYGYNNIEAAGRFNYSRSNSGTQVNFNAENRVAGMLISFGFCEIMNTSLSKDTYYPNIASGLTKVLNPVSLELNVLRKEMLFGGLEAISFNNNRKNNDLKLFEFGRVYSTDSDSKMDFPYVENRKLTLFISGRTFSENPYGLNHKSDFNNIKAYFSAILDTLGISSVKSIPIKDEEYFSFGISYQIKNKNLAKVGKVNNKVLSQFDIKQDVFVADINWDLVIQMEKTNKIEFVETPKFQAVKRDLSLLLDKKVLYQELTDLAYSTERKLLKEIDLFDVYEGERIDSNKKSYAMSFYLQDNEATLNEKQIEGVMEKITVAYREKFGAVIR